MNHLLKASPELLSPAGSWDCLRAAVANGADAVYFGLPRFNARLRTDNFSEADLPKVIDFCHRHGVKAYVTMNTLIFTGELEDAADYLRLLSREGADAILVQDFGLAELARKIVPELPVHASTQMTITSPEGAKFVRELGIQRIVLSRELSLREIKKVQAGLAAQPESQDMELEVFVHGALCVAYSGQCLTSESLGKRSANRGECAQACRMPYEMIVDGQLRDLGDKRYLLSPQDLAAVEEIPELLDLGVVSFKIEGRLKAPEYVAAVTRVYRKAIDAALEGRPAPSDPKDRYQLEMTFSRGLFSGWLHGVNHQRLVSARFGKKRGPLAGKIARVGNDFIELQSETPLKPGDGVVFDTGGNPDHEQGGRIFEVRGGTPPGNAKPQLGPRAPGAQRAELGLGAPGSPLRYFFKRGHIDFAKLKPGDRVWKTDDPALNAELQKTFSGAIQARNKQPLDLRVSGSDGLPLLLEAAGTRVFSSIPLQTARTAPLTKEKLRDHLGRFGESVFALRNFENHLQGEVILPIGELNRMRRELIYAVESQQKITRKETTISVRELLPAKTSGPATSPQLTVLCRTMGQVEAAIQASDAAPENRITIAVDFEDIRRYKEAVAMVSQTPLEILLATPRIQKAGEEGFFKLIENAKPHGVLIRNLGALEFFSHSSLRKVGDFSLNIANPLCAEYFIGRGLERVAISYDLNIQEVLALLGAAPPEWFELTLHQHMPMFHMEHCVFAAFLSSGTDHTNCGRPCDTHRVHLRDRVGIEHPLRADVGCRNTLFNATAQTGAGYFRELTQAGLRHFRVELLEENPAETARIIDSYLKLLAGQSEGENLWQSLNAQAQLGVTRGTLDAPTVGGLLP